MVATRLRQARRRLVLCVFILMLTTLGQAGHAADPFPFDQELILDAAPMRPGKRMPMLMVAPNGDATIDLWCKSMAAHIALADTSIKIEAAPLPDALPAMMGRDQCTPQRIQADGDLLAAILQVTEWRAESSGLVLLGPQMLKFRPATN